MRGRWPSAGRIRLQWQRFASMCLVIYFFLCSAIDMYPPHLLFIWYAAVCRKWGIQKSLRTTFPSLCCGSTLTWRRLGLEGASLSFSVHFLLFLRKNLMWELVRKGIFCYTSGQCEITSCDLVSDDKQFHRRSPLRKETCQKTTSALCVRCQSRRMYFLDGIKRLD